MLLMRAAGSLVKCLKRSCVDSSRVGSDTCSVLVHLKSSEPVCVERSESHLSLVWAVSHPETETIEVGHLVWAGFGCAAQLGKTDWLQILHQGCSHVPVKPFRSINVLKFRL